LRSPHVASIDKGRIAFKIITITPIGNSPLGGPRRR